LSYACGFAWAGTAKAIPRPLDVFALLDLAAARGMESVEFPAGLLPDRTPETLRRVRRLAEQHGLLLVLAAGRVDGGQLDDQLDLARALGAPTVRCTLSGVLCGDRRALPGGWRAHTEVCASAIEALLPRAEALGIALAVENHQDADSEDLFGLCRRFESPYLGVTLDTGNPLAVLEEPVEFAERVAPYLLNVHLKDYWVSRAACGARLVRCAVGRGVIDFPRLYALMARTERPVTRGLELGALHARLIPFLEPSWWSEHRPRPAPTLLGALAILWNAARPAEVEWRTPLEQDAPGPELAAYEWEEFEASLAYLAALGTPSHHERSPNPE
jgi:sugar phosphate isomerase/epimerase